MNEDNNQVPGGSQLEHFPKALKKALCRFAGYYNRQTYQFSIDSDQQLELRAADDKFSANVLIVSREYYTEEVREYPIENKTELKKLLKLELEGENHTFFHVWGTKNDKSQVNIWRFSKNLPSARVLLPESLILAMSSPVNKVTILSNQIGDDKLYVTRSVRGIQSVVRSAVINSSHSFTLSIGISPSTPINIPVGDVYDSQCKNLSNTIEQNEKNEGTQALAYRFGLGVKKLSLPLIGSFIKLPELDNGLHLFKKVVTPFLFVMALYMICASAYLSYRSNNLEQHLSEQSDDVSSALDQQVVYDQSKIRYLALKELLETKRLRSGLFTVLIELFPYAHFTNIRVVNDRYVLRGSAEKATDLLELLSKNTLVVDAKFDFPTRKSHNRDTFVISFKLNEQVNSNVSPQNGGSQNG